MTTAPLESARPAASGEAPLRFAYVDAGTKSGRIWRHTPERPNFLSNPKTEIDLTSFGCYPSVFAGEMVPISFLETGREGIQYRDFWQKVRKRLNRPTVFRRIDYLHQFDTLLVCYDLWFGNKATALLKALRASGYRGTILGAANFNLGRIREAWRNEVWYRDFTSYLDHLDIYFSLNRVGNEYVQITTKTPVVYMPQPYPYEFARKHAKPADAKKKRIFVAGDTARLDIVPTCLVAREVQRRHPDHEIVAIASMIKNRAPFEGARVTYLPNLSWEQYLDAMAESALILNLDVWWTKGRVPTDAAAVGTPCVGSNADSQMELFPDLVCDDVTGIEKAIDVSHRLITDSSFYRSTVDQAERICAGYSYDKTEKRVRSLINAWRKGKAREWSDRWPTE